MWRYLLMTAALAAAQPCMSAALWADPRPAVVELFTSQGCSSCPPADAFLGDLTRRADVLPLAYHVDYWNNLGWKDTFSSSEATRRQQGYAPRLGLDYVYTPQMVIDGHSDVVGSERSDVLSLLEDKRTGVALKVARDAQSVVVNVGAAQRDAASEDKAGDVVVVAYSAAAETKVARGENAGKTLREYNIVRGFWKLGDWHGQAESLRFDVGKLPAGSSRIALLVQAPHQGAILGATSLNIP